MAKPLDAIKSTSFFDRVDTIESSGVGAGATGPKASAKSSKQGGGRLSNKEGKSGTEGGGKQQTLFSLKSAPPPPTTTSAEMGSAPAMPSLGHTASIAMTETDPEETQPGDETETMEESEELQEAQGVDESEKQVS